MTTSRFPEARRSVPPTPTPDLDAAVARVGSRKQAWVQTPIPERIALLRSCLDSVLQVASEWVAEICSIKGLSPEANLAGEEWLSGPVTTARNLRLLIAALEAEGQPKPTSLHTRPDGQLVARVVPSGLQEKILFAGMSADVWIEPGKPATQGRIYREPKGPGRVALVLGAGNVTSIPAMDLLYKLFVEDQVVVLKMSPINAAIGPHLARVFQSLIDLGFLAIVYGGAETGTHLAEHPGIDTLHVTGSDRTYDAIVWGGDPQEQARRKAEGSPRNPREFTAELGCVTPCLVVPGEWSAADLEFQARHVASMVAHNASFNCNAAKVLVTARGWPQREAFLAKVHAALARAPGRKAYYPGAEERYRAFLEHYPDAKPLGPTHDEVVPWTVIPDVPPEAGEYALSNEAFCGIMAEVTLPSNDAEEFLEAAVEFANERCWGTLSCMLLVNEATQRRCPEAFDAAIERLRYGGIGINAWAGVIYGLVSPTWGAFPGHPSTDIQSGTGVVHNAFLFDHPQKSVLRAPFRIRPTPPWFHDHENLRVLGRRLLELEVSQSPWHLAAVAFAGLRG